MPRSVQQFAIYSPVSGIREDMPSILIPDAASVESHNVVFDDGIVLRASGRIKQFASPVNGAPLMLTSYNMRSGTKHLMVGTKNKIYCAERTACVPEMTAANAPSPVVISGDGVDMWKAFDGNDATFWVGSTSGDDTFAIIDFGAGVTKTITKVEITSTVGFVGSTVGASPAAANWQILGSNDGANYTLIYAFNPASDVLTKQEFTFPNGNAYRYYKVGCLSNWFPLYVMLLQLYEDFADVTGTATFTGDEGNLWSFLTYGDTFIFSNGVDVPYKWTGTGNIAALGGSPPVAKHLAEYKTYLILGNVVESGDAYPARIWWSAIGDPENWSTLDSGFAELEGPDQVTGFAKYGDYLYILRERSIMAMLLVGGDNVFTITKVVDGLGCLAPKSVVVTKTGFYFLGTDNRFYFFDGTQANDVSTGIKTTLASILPANLKYVSGAYMEGLDKVVWVIPSLTTSTANDMMVILDLKSGGWSTADFYGTCLCVGGYSTVEDDTWENLVGTWDEQTWKWNQIGITAGSLVNLIGTSDGYIKRLFASSENDDGTAFTGKFVSKKLMIGNPTQYKRLLKMYHYFKDEGSGKTVDITIKRDNNTTWETAKNVSLDGGCDDEMVVDHPCDFTAKTFQLQVSGTDRWRYLGTVFEYQLLGYR